MLKQFVVIAAAAVSCNASAGCNVTSNFTAAVVEKALNKNGWSFADYDKVCERLRRSNAALVIQGDATVLGGRSVAWAAVSLKDKDLPVATNSFGGSSLQINNYASIDKAEAILMDAINEAVNSMNVEKALQALNDARKQVKAGVVKPR